ncbi:hypothetical protein B0F90DRAFT_1624340, partial [Multifurca ochricompacta]
TSELGLQSFDYTTFDPTSPSSWEALRKAWTVTNGRSPSQEELMMFVMEFTIGMAGQTPTGGPPVQGDQRTGHGWMGGEARGGPPRGGRGRGAFGAREGRNGFAYGNSREDQGRWDYGGDSYAESTDAVVLGEHTNTQNGFGWSQDSHEPAQESADEEGEQQGGQGATGGRMQKVGDNWVFVRNDGSS